MSTISKSKVRKTPVEEKENKIRKNEEKEKSKSAIQSKLKDMLDRDEKYNLIMKYAHKITDADNLRNLKTLIPKENYVKIENALNGKSIIIN